MEILQKHFDDTAFFRIEQEGGGGQAELYYKLYFCL